MSLMCYSFTCLKSFKVVLCLVILPNDLGLCIGLWDPLGALFNLQSTVSEFLSIIDSTN